MRLPETGRTRDAVIDALEATRGRDVRWRDGRVFSLVYHPGDDVIELGRDAAQRFLCDNALNPTAFPSLRQLETETLQMVAGLLHGDERGVEAVGTMTSGGTESVLMAVKTARDWARRERPAIELPKMIAPTSAHPAFVKAAHYFGVELVHVPVGANGRADVEATAATIDARTILLVASAPSYPHGLLDPVQAIAALAESKGLLCHVDACIGGFMLPFVERLGTPIPAWDFRVPGVTSISLDLHKYGYAPKGASVVMYRTRALRTMQFEVFVDWPGGVWASPSMAGTRSGAPIAGAWAVWNHLGLDGYLRLAERAMSATRALERGIAAIDGLHVVGEPEMTVFAIGSETLDLYALADEMERRGWLIDRQHRPATLHLTVSPIHALHVDAILADLRASVEVVRGTGRTSEGAAAMYGMIGTMPDRALVGGFVLQLLDGFDRVG